MSRGLRHRGRLGDQGRRQIGPAGNGVHLSDRAAHQAGQGDEGGDEGPLVPHGGDDVLGRRRVDARLGQDGTDRVHAGRRTGVELTGQDHRGRRHAEDVAVRVEGGDHLRDTTEDRVGPEARDERVEVGHAIEQRHDGGVRADGGFDVRQGRVQGGRLHGEQDQVVRSVHRACRHQARCEVELLSLPRHAQAARFEGLRAGRPDQKGDVLARVREPGAEEAADGAGADREDPHGLLAFRGSGGRGAIRYGPRRGGCPRRECAGSAARTGRPPPRPGRAPRRGGSARRVPRRGGPS
ncbi:hypothetical protein SAVIM40S_00024 [Streptomyces avidinii]